MCEFRLSKQLYREKNNRVYFFHEEGNLWCIFLWEIVAVQSFSETLLDDATIKGRISEFFCVYSG